MLFRDVCGRKHPITGVQRKIANESRIRCISAHAVCLGTRKETGNRQKIEIYKYEKNWRKIMFEDNL